MSDSDEKVNGFRRIGRRRRKGTKWDTNGLSATPLLESKFDVGEDSDASMYRVHHQEQNDGGPLMVASARKLAASLWHLAQTADYCVAGVRKPESPPFDRFVYELRSSYPIPKFAKEGTTKWDYGYSNASITDHHVRHCRSHLKIQENGTLLNKFTPHELSKPRKNPRKERESEKMYLSRTKLIKCFTKDPYKEKETWIVSRDQLQEHVLVMTAIIKDLKQDLKTVKKRCSKMHALNSKLVNDISEIKLSAKELIQNYDKQKKHRGLLEDMCIELAGDIEGNRAEIKALRNQCTRIQEEVEKERIMMQIAENWREERAEMKLVDAKLILEEKYDQINCLIVELEAFFKFNRRHECEN